MFALDRAARFIHESNLIEGVGELSLEAIASQLAAEPRTQRGHAGAFRDFMELAAERSPLNCGDFRRAQRLIAYEELQLVAGWDPERDVLPPEVRDKIGDWRLEDLSQGKRGVPFPLIDERMKLLIRGLEHFLAETWPTETIIDFAADAHHEYEKIHPFADGNGRTGRLLVNYILAFYGLPLAIFTADDKNETYFPACAAPDSSPMRAYLRTKLLRGENGPGAADIDNDGC